ncbi:hypothetical protein AC152_25400 [Salmonella enterica]|nr:hypothetical protein [Salmonella enterica]EBN6690261.1 hypothetical protein [Salmonella enterica]EIY7074135.1 hypothetical protein [Salmonella enterica]
MVDNISHFVFIDSNTAISCTIEFDPFDFMRFQMIKDAFGLPFEDVFSLILSLGFECFEKEMGCEFSIKTTEK